MNLRRHDCPVAQHQIGTRRSLIGDAVPKPLGFTAFPPEWLLLFLGRLIRPATLACVTAFRPLGRRSGRIPALPYPPPR